MHEIDVAVSLSQIKLYVLEPFPFDNSLICLALVSCSKAPRFQKFM